MEHEGAFSESDDQRRQEQARAEAVKGDVPDREIRPQELDEDIEDGKGKGRPDH